MKHLLFKTACAALFLFIGWWISREANDFLSISFEKKELERSLIPAESDDKHRLTYRLIDFGGVGIIPDTVNWGENYSHHVQRFEDMILVEAPYIHQPAYERIYGELAAYLSKMQPYEPSGILMPGFIEFVNFASYENGNQIYPENSAFFNRHIVLREYFNNFAELAESFGLKTYLYTDMVTLTAPLEAYFIDRFGRVDPLYDGFWDVYQIALTEIFENMTHVDGVMIRIGEAGSVFNFEGWDYYSELYVHEADAVKMMLEKFLETAAEFDKEIIFRTWSVGVGNIGDMHTNPDTYDRVLGDIEAENLIVSTKYSNGDYYAWLPFNLTLFSGNHKRIAEFQCRREFEAFNTFPNYLGPVHQKALQKFASENPHFDGVWIWTQEGGPLRAGPLSLFPFHGFNVVTDLNVYAMGKLTLDMYADIEEITRDWVRNYFGLDSLLVESVKEMFMMSHDVVKKGLYIGDFAQYYVQALGLEPPPMLWIFEWDIVGASSAALGAIYHVCRENPAAAVEGGFEAVAGIDEMIIKLHSVEHLVTQNKEDFKTLQASLVYQKNLFETLAAYRSFFLWYYHWMSTKDRNAKELWQNALDDFIKKEAVHQEIYLGHLDFPAYNFREANVGAQIATKTTLVQNAALIFLILNFALFLLPFFFKEKFSKLSFLPAIWTNMFVPEKRFESAEGSNNLLQFLFTMVWVIVVLLIFTSFSAPIFTLYIGFLAFTYFLQLSLWLHFSGIKGKNAGLYGLYSTPFLIFAVPLIMSLYSSPMHFWFSFWVSPEFRIFFLILFVFVCFWAYLMIALKLKSAAGFSMLKTFSVILLIQGVQFCLGSGIVLYTGFEAFLTLINDELLVLPGGLSRILGITKHLNIPLGIPLWFFYTGLILGLLGLTGLLTNKFTTKKQTA